MHEYDSALKNLLQSAAKVTQRTVAGVEVAEWLNVEQLRSANLRVDLLGRIATGELLHIEFQSANDSQMPLRMAEYALAILRNKGRFPRQIVLYVGKERMTMAERLKLPGLEFEYTLINMRDIDGEPLLASPELSDNVMGILGKIADPERAIRMIADRAAPLEPLKRASALVALSMIASLRGLEKLVAREVSRMAIQVNILENEVLAPVYLRGIAEGEAKGKVEGKLEGERSLLHRMIEKRFGAIPDAARQLIENASVQQVEEWGLRLLDACSLDELLK